jgi:heme-degrading monooxygenase HmoA
VIPRPGGSGKTNGVQESFKMQTNNTTQIARSVRFDIAADRNEEFHKLFRNEVLPILKKQDGFKDELLLVDNQHVLAISVWKNADAARKYESVTYPQVDKTLRPVMIGKPTVETFEYDPLSTL